MTASSVLRFDVPGVDPEKIDVTVDKGVYGERHPRGDQAPGRGARSSASGGSGSFTRRVRLSENLDADAIEASNGDGVPDLSSWSARRPKPRKIAVGTASEAKELGEAEAAN